MLEDTLTTEELSEFLDIFCWRTTIALPAHSYFVELRAFAQGIASPCIIECGPDMLLPNTQKLTVILGRDRAAVRFSDGGSVHQPMKERSAYDGSVRRFELPRRVGLGDYSLYVVLPDYSDETNYEKMPLSARGFLLRIRSA